MIVVLALVLAITFVSVFLCLARWRPQQPPVDPPWLLRDTPKYVPPQEVAEQYYSHVKQLNEAVMRPSLDYSEPVQTAQRDTIPAGGSGYPETWTTRSEDR